MEAPFVGNPNAVPWLHGLQGVTRLLIATWQESYPHITYTAPDIQTVRKHFTGHAGGVSKEQKKRVQDRCDELGWRYKNNDESDAMAVWNFACSQMSEDHDLAKMRIFHAATASGDAT